MTTKKICTEALVPPVFSAKYDSTNILMARKWLDCVESISMIHECYRESDPEAVLGFLMGVLTEVNTRIAVLQEPVQTACSVCGCNPCMCGKSADQSCDLPVPVAPFVTPSQQTSDSSVVTIDFTTENKIDLNRLKYIAGIRGE